MSEHAHHMLYDVERLQRKAGTKPSSERTSEKL